MSMAMRIASITILFAALAGLSQTASAQDREVPYWASLRANEVNMRVGPSEDYAIDWVYHREQLPVKVIRVREGWRLVQDPDGAEGWIIARLLNPEQTALVVGDELATMRDAPSDDAELLWKVEPGVVGKLGECEAGWCRLNVHGHAGWVSEARLWGAGAP